MPELKDNLSLELQRQRNIGMELGYAIGREAGFKEGTKAAICELLYSEALPKAAVMEIFMLDQTEVESLMTVINEPRWQIDHLFYKQDLSL